MENVRIEDAHFDWAEVSVTKTDRGTTVLLDFDPDNGGDFQTLMEYTAEQARELAAALIKAAEEVEAEVDE